MAIIKPPAPLELAWRVLGLLNLYRLLVPLVLAFLHWVTPETTTVGWAHPRLFVNTDALYFAFAIITILALKQRWPSLRRRTDRCGRRCSRKSCRATQRPVPQRWPTLVRGSRGASSRSHSPVRLASGHRPRANWACLGRGSSK